MKTILINSISILLVLVLAAGCKKKDATTPSVGPLTINTNNSYTIDHRDQGNISISGGYGQKSFDFNGDGTTDLVFYMANTSSPGGAGMNYSFIAPGTDVYVSANQDNDIKAHSLYDKLDETLNWYNNNADCPSFDSSWPTDNSKKFIGLKFVHNSVIRYGWLEISCYNFYSIDYYRYIIQN